MSYIVFNIPQFHSNYMYANISSQKIVLTVSLYFGDILLDTDSLHLLVPHFLGLHEQKQVPQVGHTYIYIWYIVIYKRRVLYLFCDFFYIQIQLPTIYPFHLKEQNEHLKYF